MDEEGVGSGWGVDEEGVGSGWGAAPYKTTVSSDIFTLFWEAGGGGGGERKGSS